MLFKTELLPILTTHKRSNNDCYFLIIKQLPKRYFTSLFYSPQLEQIGPKWANKRKSILKLPLNDYKVIAERIGLDAGRVINLDLATFFFFSRQVLYKVESLNNKIVSSLVSSHLLGSEVLGVIYMRGLVSSDELVKEFTGRYNGAKVEEAINRLMSQNLIVTDGQSYCITSYGLEVLNLIGAQLRKILQLK